MPSIKTILERVLAPGRPDGATALAPEPPPPPPRSRDEHLADFARRSLAARREATPPRPERVFRHAKPRDETLPRPGSNHAPPLEETLIQEIARVGTAMYGENWIPGVAADTGESVRTVRKWLAGTSEPTPLDLRAVREAARRHVARIQRALGE